jgi:predicted RND superfamily exporter protein
MSLVELYGDRVSRYSKVVVVVMLVATAVVGSAAGDVPPGISISSFGSDSTEAQKLEYVQKNFDTGAENATVVQVVVRDDDVLDRETVLSTLRYQQALQENGTVNATLADGRASVSVANLVATAAINRERAAAGERPLRRPPPLAEQVEQVESMSAAEVEAVVASVLDPDRERRGGADPYALLPKDYDPGSSEADGTVVLVTQRTDGDGDLAAATIDGQLAARDLAEREFGSAETFAFGQGIVEAEALQATAESGPIMTPAILLLIVSILLFTYRDPLDVSLAVAGIGVVLAWMFGFMGWVGIGVNQLIIAVPFLLMGLSIDYGLHVVMRYREATADLPDEAGSPSVQAAMGVGLGGVSVALAATTFTTAVGFLANLVSPIASIREFAIVAAAGIVSTFLVFTLLVPALKVEAERLLAWVGFAREKSAFGRAGAANRVLQFGTTAARRAPVAIVLVGLLVSAGGAYAATDIDTSIDRIDQLPEDPPEWKQQLGASDYTIRENAKALNDQFVRSSDQARAEILIEGSVTDPTTLERVAAGRAAVADTQSGVTLADGQPAVEDPLVLLNRTAATNDTVAAVVARNDGDGDGIPDGNLAAVYDAVYAANPDAAEQVIYREDGAYVALRMTVTVEGGADSATVTREMRDVATVVAGDTGLTVTATGSPIVEAVVQSGLLRTLVVGFAITLTVIAAFLTVIFYRRYGTPTLGLVTMVPVVFALAWILGTMYVLGLPFSTETAVITSIAIGVGVDYAIHMSERYLEERDDSGSPMAALERAIAGTGGALLASAGTTAAGFGALMLALVPQLQRFGLVTSITVVYAFGASVVLLPSLLVLWERVGDDSVAAGEPAGGD